MLLLLLLVLLLLLFWHIVPCMRMNEKEQRRVRLLFEKKRSPVANKRDVVFLMFFQSSIRSVGRSFVRSFVRLIVCSLVHLLVSFIRSPATATATLFLPGWHISGVKA